MPKLKTRKGVKKRFRITKTGKIKMARSGKSHLLSSKKEGRKRRLKIQGYVTKSSEKTIKTAMPYGR